MKPPFITYLNMSHINLYPLHPSCVYKKIIYIFIPMQCSIIIFAGRKKKELQVHEDHERYPRWKEFAPDQ